MDLWGRSWRGGSKYYGLSNISVTVTKGGHLRGSRHYKTSKTIGWGLAKLRKQFSM